MKFRLPTALYFACLLLVTTGFADFHTFTNDDGVSVEAELIEVSEDGEVVTIKLRSGATLPAQLSAFSSKDQKFIKDWWKKEEQEKRMLRESSRIRVSAKLNQKASKNGRYSGYYNIDDKTRAYFPEVVIENDEVTTFKNNNVRVVVIAEDLGNPGQKLIVSASDQKADFPYTSKTVLESDPFRLRLYEYDSRYSNYEYKYGYKYEGYVVVIKNSRGEITHTRASRSKYLTNMKVILNCKAGELYDDGINVKFNTRPNSYFIQ